MADSGSWVSLGDSVSGRSISVGGGGDWDNGGISISKAGLSRSLASQTLWGSLGERSGESWVSSNTTETISIGIWVSISVWGSITVGTIEKSGISLWLSISRSLSIDIGSASVTGGLGVWGAHSWPVGVSVEEGRGNQDTWVSLSRDADSDGSSNLENWNKKVKIHN